MLTCRISIFGTGGCNRWYVNDHRMSERLDCFLFYKGFVTYRAVFALRATCCGASRIYCGINDNLVLGTSGVFIIVAVYISVDANDNDNDTMIPLNFFMYRYPLSFGSKIIKIFECYASRKRRISNSYNSSRHSNGC